MYLSFSKGTYGTVLVLTASSFRCVRVLLTVHLSFLLHSHRALESSPWSGWEMANSPSLVDVIRLSGYAVCPREYIHRSTGVVRGDDI